MLIKQLQLIFKRRKMLLLIKKLRSVKILMLSMMLTKPLVMHKVQLMQHKGKLMMQLLPVTINKRMLILLVIRLRMLKLFLITVIRLKSKPKMLWTRLTKKLPMILLLLITNKLMLITQQKLRKMQMKH